MENNKNNKKLVILLTTIIICLLLGGGFIIYKVLSDTPNTNLGGSGNNNQHLSGEQQYETWFEYVLSTEINSVEITTCNDTEEVTTTIPTSELKNIFAAMEKGTLVKDFDGGLGGVCMENININYTNGETNYNLSLVNNEYIDLEYLKDNNILSYLENSNYKILNNSNSNVVQGFIYNYDQTVVTNIINDNSEKKETPEWVKYLLNQNITEIKYYSGKVLINDQCEQPKNMTKNQLQTVLEKMTKSKLTKTHMAGLGGVCDIGITVKYANKEITIYANQVIDSKYTDNKIVSLLEKEKYTLEKYDELEDKWYYIYNWDTTYMNSLFR